MKTKLEAYSIGTEVYAIFPYHPEKGEVTYSIHRVFVAEVNFSVDKATNKPKPSYWLKTPSGDECQDYIEENHVHKSFNKAAAVLKELWDKDKNFH